MAGDQNINMRINAETLDSIDHNAKQNGQNRTTYILSWLPDTYKPAPSKAETQQNKQQPDRR
jgi:predicted DNA binding CopG/RHH family protein